MDAQLEKQYVKFSKKVEVIDKPLEKLSRSKVCRSQNAPDYDLRTYLYKIAGVDLVRVDGFNIINVQEIISETGVDMSKWPTGNDFASWLTASPNNKVTGGKVFARKTKRSKSRAYKVFRMAASSTAKTDSPIGRFYRKMRAIHGGPHAIASTAHKLARIFYAMIRNQEEYSREKLEQLEEKNREKSIQSLKRRAAKYGFDLVPKGA